MSYEFKYLGEMTSYGFKTNIGCESREEVGSFEEKQPEAKYLMQIYL